MREPARVSCFIAKHSLNADGRARAASRWSSMLRNMRSALQNYNFADEQMRGVLIG
jgi:hypothetical protein